MVIGIIKKTGRGRLMDEKEIILADVNGKLYIGEVEADSEDFILGILYRPAILVMNVVPSQSRVAGAGASFVTLAHILPLPVDSLNFDENIKMTWGIVSDPNIKKQYYDTMEQIKKPLVSNA